MVGAGIFLLFAFILPSSLSYNPLAELLRVFMGIALLLPVPLGVVSLAFFILGAVASSGSREKRNLSMAGAGLALSAVSATVFVLAMSLAPAL